MGRMSELQRRNWKNCDCGCFDASDMLPLGSVYLTAGKAAGPNVELPMKGSKRITEKPV